MGSCIAIYYIIIGYCALTGLMLHTDSFDDKPLRWPQGSPHPRFSQHLQVVRVPLNEKHIIFHPSLKVNFSYGLGESFIPETAQVLRFEVRKDLLSARRVGVEFSSTGAQTLLVRAEDHGERSGGELDDPRLVRHFWRLYRLQGGEIMLGIKMHLLKESFPLWKSR